MVIFRFLVVVLPVLFAVAFLTLFERKVLAAAGKRVGPNVVGYGFLQPLADGLKLLTKETVVPTAADKALYFVAPVVSFGLALTSYSFLPVAGGVLGFSCSLLFVLALSGLGVYGVVLSGWSSNSRYAFLGALRAAAQMISYEVSLGLILLSNCLFVGSLDLFQFGWWQQNYVYLAVPLAPGAVLFFLSALAETNRPPFDLPEAEGELVAGYYVEYAAAGFALFFIAEYANIIFLSCLWGVLFGGGFSPVGAVVVMFCFVWVRSAYPRYRYDQLMRLGWKVFLPLALALFFYSFCLVALSPVKKYHVFHLVNVSPWPVLSAVALFNLVVSFVGYLHNYDGFFEDFFFHLANLAGVAGFWWRDVIREATFGGHHTRAVQKGLKMGFTLFLVSEAMLFFSLFWAFFYLAVHPSGPYLGTHWSKHIFHDTIQANHVPLANTYVLLGSGATLTFSHYRLLQGRPAAAVVGMVGTLGLGLVFLFLQGVEYKNAKFDISDGVFGSTFYLLTGFHGVHVLVGWVFLAVGLSRLRAGHFTPTRHLGYEMAVWYWHFVDVIWVFLFFAVYVWGTHPPITSGKLG